MNGRILIRVVDVGLLFAWAGWACVISVSRRIGHFMGLKSSEAPCNEPRRIVFLIHDLGCGGAQRQLVLLLKYLDRTQWLPEVVVMDMTDPFFAPELERLGVPIVHVQPHRIFWSSIVWRLMAHLAAQPCQILHNWLPDSIHAGSIAGTIVGVPVIVASMRSEAPNCAAQKVQRWRRMIDIVAAQLSAVLLGNSKAVCATYQRWLRVPANRMEVAYNGVEVACAADIARSVREQWRAENWTHPQAPVVGIIARLDEDKDHETFLRMARRVHEERSDVRFAIIGDGPLRKSISEAMVTGGMDGYVSMFGRCADTRRMMQLLDVVVLTSVSEGCPNVLLEAAELGVPAVSTAAGGAVELISDGETGFVVPCKDSLAMADRVILLLSDSNVRDSVITEARSRVRSQFSMPQAVRTLDAVYRRAIAQSTAAKGGKDPVRVCFMLSQAYGVFRPRPDRVFGGAEVQVASLAKQLVRQGGGKVYVLTGERQQNGREEIDGVTVVLDPFCAPTHSVPVSSDSLKGAGEGPPRSKLVTLGYQWLAWCPPALAALSRALVRGGVICKKQLRTVLPLDWWVRTVRNLSVMFRWIRLLRSIDADVVVTRCAGASVGFMQRACSLLRRPFIYMVAHDMDVSGEYASTYPIEGALFERGLCRADVVICQNKNQADLLFTRYGRRGYVVPSLCPFEITSGLEQGSRKYVFWIARVDNWKQPEMFIRLASRIPDQSFIMVAVASQVNPSQLESIQKAAQAVPNLKVLPAIPLHETATFFREAAVFVNTSKAEGFPNTYLQAAASGTPIVSWSVNPDNMLDRYEMGLCAQEDEGRFEQAVRLLCRDSMLRVRMGNNGLEYVRQRHGPDAVAQTYLRLFADLREGCVPRDLYDSEKGACGGSGWVHSKESPVLTTVKGE